MEVKNFWLTKIEKRLLLIYLRRLNFKLLSWLLQCFGHIQSKNKDVKSVVNIFLKSAIGFSPGYSVERVISPVLLAVLTVQL